MNHWLLTCSLLGVICSLAATAGPPLLTNLTKVPFQGAIPEDKDLSGVGIVGDFLVLVSDEGKKQTKALILKKSGDGYKTLGSVPLPGGEDEIDLEAVAVEGNMVYVSGSHCSARKIEDGKIGEVKPKKSREQFFRFRLKPDGTTDPVEGPKSLDGFLDNDPVMSAFRRVASKENGVDIEGLAVKDGVLHFGFRGPVLRYGLTPVLSCTWDNPRASAKLRYVRLDGRGIRDLVAVAGGFLVLAGPVGDGDTSYRVYFWDGADQMGDGENGPKPKLLGEFPDLGEGKPEGLAVLRSEGPEYELLLICDGLPGGGASRWKVRK